jgi:hypothetical protein
MVVHDTTEQDPKYKCAECNLQFGTPRDLSRHLHKTARHGGQPSPCAICHKPLTRPDSRARHERRCRERFGVTEEMWQGIERERQRGRRKSISVDSVDDANRLPGDDSGGSGGGDPTAAGQERGGGGGGSGGGSVSSRSRAASISDLSDPNDLAAAFASAQVASSAPPFAPGSAPESRFAPQPGEPSSWTTRRRSTSLRTPHPVPTVVAASSPSSSTKNGAMDLNGRKRRESSPHSRRGVHPPQARVTSSPTINPSWRPLNRPLSFHQVREDSPPFEPPSSPMAMYESDGESMVHASTYRQPSLPPQPSQRWATLAKRDGPIVELAQEGDDDEVDELAGDEDGPWHPSASPRAHAHHAHRAHHHIRTTEGTITGPPPKKKLFGFEADHAHASAGSVAGWSAHRSQQR